MPRPTFVLVVEDGSRLEALRRDLSRRYEADYQVIAVASAPAALGTLRDLAGSGVVVALVLADERMAVRRPCRRQLRTFTPSAAMYKYAAGLTVRLGHNGDC